MTLCYAKRWINVFQLVRCCHFSKVNRFCSLFGKSYLVNSCCNRAADSSLPLFFIQSNLKVQPPRNTKIHITHSLCCWDAHTRGKTSVVLQHGWLSWLTRVPSVRRLQEIKQANHVSAHQSRYRLIAAHRKVTQMFRHTLKWKLKTTRKGTGFYCTR
jgi:hypothetical protein